MNLLLSIDSGTTHSAYTITEHRHLHKFGKVDNREMLNIIEGNLCRYTQLAIEEIASYGMPVGKTVFTTCQWTGRFIQAHENATGRTDYLGIPRKDVCLYLNNSPRGNDSTVRAALIDMYGGSKKIAVGIKAEQGPLYGVANDVWAALGVAMTATHRIIYGGDND